MEQILSDLFALQRFAGDGALQAVIDEVEGRYAIAELDDDALAGLSAAGDPFVSTRERMKKDPLQ